MSTRSGFLTPIQVRDNKIKDLKTQLTNEKSARRNDKEQYEYKCAELENNICDYKKTIEMLQSEISRINAENES